MLRKLKLILIPVLPVLVINLSYASGVKSLELFMHAKNDTMSANFTQTVFGKRKNQVTEGSMEIQRPNKFRWEYANGGQLIISDGRQIYIYDSSLQQVTIKKLTKTLGRTPALLLAGGVDIKQVYKIVPEPDAGGLEWVLLDPKNSNDNNGFKSIALGFSKSDSQLAMMQFEDSFGDKSQIKFTNFKSQIKIPASEFKFVVAKGTDVVNADNQ